MPPTFSRGMAIVVTRRAAECLTRYIVRDDEIGVADSHKERIFIRFERAVGRNNIWALNSVSGGSGISRDRWAAR